MVNFNKQIKLEIG